MTIAILGTRGIPARYGGFETFAEELAPRLVKQGIEVTVYCEAGETDQPASYHGIRLVYLPAPDCGPLTTVLFDLRCLWHARKGHDVVYMLGYGAAPFCFIPRIWGSRVWLNVDGIEWARSKWNRAARLYFRIMETVAFWTPTRIIADAEAIRAHLISRHSPRKPVSVIPYGAPLIEMAPDPALLREWGLQPEGYYLIVCRLEPENHVREIISGFVSTSSKRQLVIAGNIRGSSAYVQSLLDIKDSRIRFIGTVFAKERIQALRYHAYAYCHGHSVGGTNPSLLEALGCGNAVIAHDNAFNREVAGDAAVYFLTSGDFSGAVSSLEDGTVARSFMKSRGADIVRRSYNWERVTAAYLDLLRNNL